VAATQTAARQQTAKQQTAKQQTRLTSMCSSDSIPSRSAIAVAYYAITRDTTAAVREAES
jgi:hypothetical protein